MEKDKQRHTIEISEKNKTCRIERDNKKELESKKEVSGIEKKREKRKERKMVRRM